MRLHSRANTRISAIVVVLALIVAMVPALVNAAPAGAAAVIPTGYVTSFTANTVTPFNSSTGGLGTPIPLGAGAGPRGVAMSPDGTKAYVVEATAGKIAVIDTATGFVHTTLITAGTNPYEVAFNPNYL
jgi:YVTN family beta-propeller protein